MPSAFMTWDQALNRKFCSTSHFRLLNQVRSELKAQPLERDPENRTLRLAAKPLKGVLPRNIRRSNSSESIDKEKNYVDPSDDGPRSFRERLNAIEMR